MDTEGHTAGQDDSGAEPVRRFTVVREEATIAVSRGGRGRPLVLCPGLFSTQADLAGLAGALRAHFDVVTFDLRGHGRSFGARRYRFTSFLADLEAVMAELGRGSFPSAPVMAGHSMGADLVLHYTAAHPGASAGLVLLDGANPLPEPFLSGIEPAELRAMAEGMQAALAEVRGTERQVLLDVDDFVELNVEIDRLRVRLPDRLRGLELPVHVIASSAMAGRGDDDQTRWRNANWRAGFERLGAELPQAEVTWLDADHGLVVTHADRIAEMILEVFGPDARAGS
ncbi:hypothetical protein GCM10009853_093810 [Glycomyces scopariae]